MTYSFVLAADVNASFVAEYGAYRVGYGYGDSAGAAADADVGVVDGAGAGGVDVGYDADGWPDSCCDVLAAVD